MADEKPKTVKQVVTNVSDGPKIINSIPPVILQAGQSTDGPVELTEAEVAAAKDGEWFKFGAAAAKAAADPLDHDGDGRKGGAKKAD